MTESIDQGLSGGAAGSDDKRPTIAAAGAQVGVTTLAEPAQFRMVLVSFLAAGIGLIAGGIAFLKLIDLLTNISFYGRFAVDFTSARHNHLGLWVIPIPVIGRIIVGVMAKYGSSKTKGHGIPEAMEAVLFNRSRIQPRVAILKPISAAIAIGTCGPFGAEGPIIQTGGAVGSLVGQVFPTTASECKVQLACGAAADLSATFNTPIAGVILAIELLLFEFKARSFIPLVVASTLATDVHRLELLIVVMLAKAVALVISLGSGTSGGLLAPMFLSSAALRTPFCRPISVLPDPAAGCLRRSSSVPLQSVVGAPVQRRRECRRRSRLCRLH